MAWQPEKPGFGSRERHVERLQRWPTVPTPAAWLRLKCLPWALWALGVLGGVGANVPRRTPATEVWTANTMLGVPGRIAQRQGAQHKSGDWERLLGLESVWWISSTISATSPHDPSTSVADLYGILAFRHSGFPWEWRNTWGFVDLRLTGTTSFWY